MNVWEMSWQVCFLRTCFTVACVIPVSNPRKKVRMKWNENKHGILRSNILVFLNMNFWKMCEKCIVNLLSKGVNYTSDSSFSLKLKWQYMQSIRDNLFKFSMVFSPIFESIVEIPFSPILVTNPQSTVVRTHGIKLIQSIHI